MERMAAKMSGRDCDSEHGNQASPRAGQAVGGLASGPRGRRSACRSARPQGSIALSRGCRSGPPCPRRRRASPVQTPSTSGSMSGAFHRDESSTSGRGVRPGGVFVTKAPFLRLVSSSATRTWASRWGLPAIGLASSMCPLRTTASCGVSSDRGTVFDHEIGPEAPDCADRPRVEPQLAPAGPPPNLIDRESHPADEVCQPPSP